MSRAVITISDVEGDDIQLHVDFGEEFKFDSAAHGMAARILGPDVMKSLTPAEPIAANEPKLILP